MDLDLKSPWQALLETIKTNLSASDRIYLQLWNKPILINRYYREYYESKTLACRITFDTQIFFASQLNFTKPNLDKGVHEKIMIVEIKSDKVDYADIKSIMKYLPAPFQSYSKYLRGYEVTRF